MWAVATMNRWEESDEYTERTGVAESSITKRTLVKEETGAPAAP